MAELTASSDAAARTGTAPSEEERSPAGRRGLRSLRCGPGSCGRPSRETGGGVFCRRGASYVTCSSTSLVTVADLCPREEWCVACATAIATAIRSCRSIERRRRSRRRLAAPAPSTPAMASTARVSMLRILWERQLSSGSDWWWWWCGRGVNEMSLSVSHHEHAPNSGENAWESDSGRPRHLQTLDDQQLLAPRDSTPKRSPKKASQPPNPFRHRQTARRGTCLRLNRNLGDEQQLRNLHSFKHCRGQHLTCTTTVTSTTLAKNWSTPKSTTSTRTSTTLSKYCNCGTSTVFCTLNSTAPVVAHQRACERPCPSWTATPRLPAQQGHRPPCPRTATVGTPRFSALSGPEPLRKLHGLLHCLYQNGQDHNLVPELHLWGVDCFEASATQQEGQHSVDELDLERELVAQGRQGRQQWTDTTPNAPAQHHRGTHFGAPGRRPRRM